MKKYIYTRLSSFDFTFFRLGGPGLANCMFFAARAIVLAKQYDAIMLRPTWERLGIGALLRKEKDARFYTGLFRKDSLMQRLKKFFLLLFANKFDEKEIGDCNAGVVVVSGWTGFNEKLPIYYDDIKKYFDEEILPSAIRLVPETLHGNVAVHIRLGDMPKEYRVPLDWYIEKIKQVRESCDRPLSFLIFSDGNDSELKDLMALPNTRRVFFGNALADMVAISRCSLVIGSVSTFSWWGAYFGQVPCIFDRDHSGCMLRNKSMMLISQLGERLPSNYVVKAMDR